MYSKRFLKIFGHSIFPCLVVVGLTIVPAYLFWVSLQISVGFPVLFFTTFAFVAACAGFTWASFAAQHR